MKRYLLMILVLVCGTASAQRTSYPYTLVDRFCECPEFRWTGHSYEFTDISQSVHDIEIRMRYAYKQQLTYTAVLSKKDGTFEAYFYYRKPLVRLFLDSLSKYEKWEEFPYKKYKMTDINVDSIFTELVIQNAFSLPDQRTLYKGRSQLTNTIEYKLNGHYGKFTFGKPYSPIKPESPFELKNYQSIRNLFHKFVEPYVKQAQKDD